MWSYSGKLINSLPAPLWLPFPLQTRSQSLLPCSAPPTQNVEERMSGRGNEQGASTWCTQKTDKQCNQGTVGPVTMATLPERSGMLETSHAGNKSQYFPSKALLLSACKSTHWCRFASVPQILKILVAIAKGQSEWAKNSQHWHQNWAYLETSHCSLQSWDWAWNHCCQMWRLVATCCKTCGSIVGKCQGSA